MATVGGSPLGAAEASRESVVAGREASRALVREREWGREAMWRLASESRCRITIATASGRECGGGLEWRWETGRWQQEERSPRRRTSPASREEERERARAGRRRGERLSEREQNAAAGEGEGRQ